MYRRLTIGELEKLQGLTVGYTGKSRSESGKEYLTPMTHRAKAIGNGFTIPVIEHILGHIPEIRSGEWK